MKDINKIIIALILAVAVNIGAVNLIAIHAQPSVQRLGDIGQQIYTGYPTNTGILCGVTSTPMLATSTSRRFVEIRNDSGKEIWLGLGVAAATSTGIALTATSTTFTISPYTLLFTGAINCIAQSNASTTVLEAK